MQKKKLKNNQLNKNQKKSKSKTFEPKFFLKEFENFSKNIKKLI